MGRAGAIKFDWLKVMAKKTIKGKITIDREPRSVPPTESKWTSRSIKRATLRLDSRKTYQKAKKAAPDVPSAPRSALK